MELSFVENLGMGTMGCVDLVRMDARALALKTIKKQSHNYNRQSVEREISVARLMSHPGIVATMTSWEDKENTYILMEYVKGHDLISFMEALDGPLPETFARRVFDQLRQIVLYMHSMGVAHRDLKLDNIMLDDNGQVKIIDFGLCTYEDVQNCTGAVGSAEYCAPEVEFGGSPYDGHLADIWSMGVVLYALLFNSFPFSVCGWNHLMTTGRVELSFPANTRCSMAARDLVQSMLAFEPSERITLQEMAEHPWLQRKQ